MGKNTESYQVSVRSISQIRSNCISDNSKNQNTNRFKTGITHLKMYIFHHICYTYHEVRQKALSNRKLHNIASILAPPIVLNTLTFVLDHGRFWACHIQNKSHHRSWIWAEVQSSCMLLILRIFRFFAMSDLKYSKTSQYQKDPQTANTS